MLRSDSYKKRYGYLTKKLREAREEVGLTQEQVAALLGRPQSYIAKVELSERRLDVIELSEIAKVYKKTLDYFLLDEI